VAVRWLAFEQGHELMWIFLGDRKAIIEPPSLLGAGCVESAPSKLGG
jgi:hypothetical protein